MNTLNLDNRTAVITGAARGMGFAFAERFLKSGASVSLWDVNEETLEGAQKKLSQLGPVTTQKVDVSDYENVEQAAADAESAFGGIDILVNAAGIETEMLADVSDQQIEYMLSKIPMGRMGSVEEIASMVGWMCSEECSYTTGAVFDLSGGRATY